MANIIIRTLILFFFLLLMLRLLGKRQIGELQPYEFALTLISSNLITIPMSNLSTPLLWGIIPVYVLLATGLCLSLVSLKSTVARRIICGKPRMLIERGVIVESALKKVRYTLNDLLEQLRNKDVFDVSQVYYAILETNGEISVILKSQFAPLTPADMRISTQQEDATVSLIMDGKFQKQNLYYLGKDFHWLQKQMQKAKVLSEKDVLLMTYNGSKLFVHFKGENPKIKEIVCET